MSHTDSASPINTIIIKIILHTYLLYNVPTCRLNFHRGGADMSGFCSLSTFNRHFVKVTGVSPKNYYKPILENSRKATEPEESL